MSQPQIDELDKQLINILSKDARISNRKIAGELGVTEGTVRGRIRRLQKERLIAFTAITSFEMEDSTRMAIIGIQVDPAQVADISRKISDIPAINAVMVTMGRFNIMAFCLFSELDQLHEISSDQVLAMSGVHHVETSIAVRTLKYNARIVHISG